jgi:hypothetical protein
LVTYSKNKLLIESRIKKQSEDRSIFALPLLRLDLEQNEVLENITYLNNIDSALPYEVDDVLGKQNGLQTYWKYLDKSIAPSKLIQTYLNN